jgi:hypothetical protein
MRIRVRISPLHPLVCRKRRLNGAVLRMRSTGKTEAPCHSRCGTIKIPICSKALSAEHRPKFCCPSPVMVTSPYKLNILERDVKQSINGTNKKLIEALKVLTSNIKQDVQRHFIQRHLSSSENDNLSDTPVLYQMV